MLKLEYEHLEYISTTIFNLKHLELIKLGYELI